MSDFAPWKTSNGKSAPSSRMQVRDATSEWQGHHGSCTCADRRLGEWLGRDPKCVRGESGEREAVDLGRGCTASLRLAPPSLRPAGTVILELSKEKTNERLLDRQAAAFTASVQHVEAELSAQIRYLTQVGVSGRRCTPTPASDFSLSLRDSLAEY